VQKESYGVGVERKDCAANERQLQGQRDLSGMQGFCEVDT